MPRWTSGSSPRRSRLASQARNPARIRPPAAITKGVSERPKGSIGELFGSSQPQLLACRTPRTMTPEAGGGEHPADPVEPRHRAGPRRLLESAACRAGCRSRRRPRRRRPRASSAPSSPSRRGSGRRRSRRRRRPRARRRPGPGPGPGSWRRPGRPSPASPARRRSPRGSTSRASGWGRSRRPP